MERQRAVPLRTNPWTEPLVVRTRTVCSVTSAPYLRTHDQRILAIHCRPDSPRNRMDSMLL
jgi:hypothetical protein